MMMKVKKRVNVKGFLRDFIKSLGGYFSKFTASVVCAALFIISLLPSALLAQKTERIELLHANSLEYDESLGNKARRLIGEVSFKHEGAIMYCDSAYMYSETNSLDAFSRVRIVQGDTLNLTGDKLNYAGDNKSAVVTGNVTLVDKEITLTCEQLYYDMKKKTAWYNTGGKIVEKDNVLTSQLGYYFSALKEVSFRQNVLLVNPKYTIECDTLRFHTVTEVAYFMSPTIIRSDENTIYCESGWYDTKNDVSQFSKKALITAKEQTISGDSLYYDRKNGYGKAIGNAEVNDTTKKIIVNGEFGEYFADRERTMITGKALFRQIFDKDTLYLHSDTIYSIADTLKNAADTTEKRRSVYAYHHVKFYKSDMQGKCDSLVYSFSDSLISMFNTPILWSDVNQITADTVRMRVNDGKITSFLLQNIAFIISKEDSAQYNQIKGKFMEGFFENNELRRVKVVGNGQTIYYAKENDGSMMGVNKAESNDLMIHVSEKKVQELVFITQAEATLYPMAEIDLKDMLLRDFLWEEDKRPIDLLDIFLWR